MRYFAPEDDRNSSIQPAAAGESPRAALSVEAGHEAGLISHPGLTYLKYILLAAIAITAAVTIQVYFVFTEFEWRYLFVPFFLTLFIGMLMGRVAFLREQLRRKSEQFRAVADFAQEFTYFRRVDGSYEYVSPSCLTLTGYSTGEFYAMPRLMDQLIHHDDRERWQHHVHQVNNAGLPETLDVRLVTREGRMIWVSHVCGPVYAENGAQIGVRSTNLDITQRKVFEDRIEQMAYYDALTDLPNRYALSRELESRILSASQAREKFAVLFLDLDRFKQLNDSFGHAFGDNLLRQIGERLRSCCSSNTVKARVGGDEFVIVVPQIVEASDAVEVARRLLSTVEQPFRVDGKELYISGSIGIALYPYDGEDPDALVRNADVAMYKSKKELQGNVRLYSPELAQNTKNFVSMESRLRKALKEKEFITYFQPIVTMTSGKIIGVEALARWQHPDRGIVLPDEFIPLAEEIGLTRHLGEQILAQVCEQLHHWHSQGIAVPVGLNISARQFEDAEFCTRIEQSVHLAGCGGGMLDLEITETTLLGNTSVAVEKLERLRGLGVSISLDDFGTGYSSLSYLNKLPIDKIKIDRSFVSSINRHPRDQVVLRAVLALCRELDLKVVTEGVETEEQKRLLQALGCDACQGFLFYRPVPPEEIESLLRAHRRADDKDF